jgi:hypothetical protein
MSIINFHKDFVGVYDDALSNEECIDIINQFNFLEKTESDKVFVNENLHGSPLIRKDFAIFADQHLPNVQKIIGDRLHECLLQYCEHYFVIKSIQANSIFVKLQRTPPRGGYHSWHCEQDCFKHANRILVWTIYLNDIPYNEGETEFLWQGIRINPKAGRCVIWPAAFTHTHRGNPVYTHDKYIATGWYNLIN